VVETGWARPTALPTAAEMRLRHARRRKANQQRAPEVDPFAGLRLPDRETLECLSGRRAGPQRPTHGKE